MCLESLLCTRSADGGVLELRMTRASHERAAIWNDTEKIFMAGEAVCASKAVEEGLLERAAPTRTVCRGSF